MVRSERNENNKEITILLKDREVIYKLRNLSVIANELSGEKELYLVVGIPISNYKVSSFDLSAEPIFIQDNYPLDKDVLSDKMFPIETSISSQSFKDFIGFEFLEEKGFRLTETELKEIFYIRQAEKEKELLLV
jgi:hypothetical protein